MHKIETTAISLESLNVYEARDFKELDYELLFVGNLPPSIDKLYNYNVVQSTFSI